MQNVKSSPAQKGSVDPIPEGMHSVTPYLIVDGAEKFIEFTKNAFNAESTFIWKGEDNKVMHATVKIGDSIIMLGDSMEGFKPMPCMLHLYVADVDAQYKQALKAGAQSVREPKDEFYGDRSSGVKDPWGNQWWIATHVEDVSEEELKKTMAIGFYPVKSAREFWFHMPLRLYDLLKRFFPESYVYVQPLLITGCHGLPYTP